MELALWRDDFPEADVKRGPVREWLTKQRQFSILLNTRGGKTREISLPGDELPLPLLLVKHIVSGVSGVHIQYFRLLVNGKQIPEEDDPYSDKESHLGRRPTWGTWRFALWGSAPGGAAHRLGVPGYARAPGCLMLDLILRKLWGWAPRVLEGIFVSWGCQVFLMFQT